MDKKILKKDAVDGRHLVITVKLAQFLTDRTQSGINRFRTLPGVSWAKKKFWKKFMLGRDLVITVKLAQPLTGTVEPIR